MAAGIIGANEQIFYSLVEFTGNRPRFRRSKSNKYVHIINPNVIRIISAERESNGSHAILQFPRNVQYNNEKAIKIIYDDADEKSNVTLEDELQIPKEIFNIFNSEESEQKNDDLCEEKMRQMTTSIESLEQSSDLVAYFEWTDYIQSLEQ
eukprot:304137_1